MAHLRGLWCHLSIRYAHRWQRNSEEFEEIVNKCRYTLWKTKGLRADAKHQGLHSWKLCCIEQGSVGIRRKSIRHDDVNRNEQVAVNFTLFLLSLNHDLIAFNHLTQCMRLGYRVHVDLTGQGSLTNTIALYLLIMPQCYGIASSAALLTACSACCQCSTWHLPNIERFILESSTRTLYAILCSG